LQNFVSGIPHAIFSKNTRILTVIFIGHRQLNNAYFHLPTTCIHRYTFCSSNLLFIQQLLDILYSFKKTDRYYVLKEILYEILSLKASIQGEKIVINNLQPDGLKLLLNEVLIALSSSKNNTNSTIRLHDLNY
jgi:hypothetical protein